MNWIDIKRVHPDQVIDWKDKDEVSLLAVVHYTEGSDDISVQEVAHPRFRNKKIYACSKDGFTYTGSMKRVSHWMLLPDLPS